jgi:hypothetical protein
MSGRGVPGAWPDWPDAPSRPADPRAPGAARAGETVPWTVLPVYADRHPLRMLRLLGRRRAGLLSRPDLGMGAGARAHLAAGRLDALLDSWLEIVRRERVVVAYCPMTDEGFHYLDDSMRTGPCPDVPVRTAVVRWIDEMPVRLIDDGRPRPG